MAEANPSIPGNTNSVRPAPRQDKGLSLFIAIQPEMITEHFLHSNDLMLNSSYIAPWWSSVLLPSPFKSYKTLQATKTIVVGWRWWAAKNTNFVTSLSDDRGKKIQQLVRGFYYLSPHKQNQNVNEGLD